MNIVAKISLKMIACVFLSIISVCILIWILIHSFTQKATSNKTQEEITPNENVKYPNPQEISLLVPNKLKQINYVRAKILYHTDHEELLAICRQKMADYKKSNINHNKNQESHYSNQSLPVDSPNNKELIKGPASEFMSIEDIPQKTYMQILDLNPTFVYISQNWMSIELCTVVYSVSVTVFAEGIEGHGDIKLIDGLWYNDDACEQDPNCAEHLKKLKEYDLDELKTMSL